MLKKIFRSFNMIAIVSLFLFLSGCSLFNKTTTNSSQSTNSTQQLTQTITKFKDLTVVDIATEYIISAQTLPTYLYKEDPSVSYVNIDEFIEFMDGGIYDLTITHEEVMSISYTFDVPEEYQSELGLTYTYEMTIDAVNEVVSFNDFDMLSNINVPMLTEYETDLTVASIDYVDVDPSKTINLSTYGYDIVAYEGGYYIPLYLANLFFSGAYINVYEMNNSVYVFDNFSELDELMNNFEVNNDLNITGIRNHTKNYLALYFDYFYGLKDYQNVNSYKDVLIDYRIEEKTDYTSLHEELERYVNDLNDLHTSIVSPGYMDEEFRAEVSTGTKTVNLYDAYLQNQCYNRESEVATRSYGTTLVIEVNEFTLDTREKLIPAMETAKNYNDIVIDVSCNLGGHLIGVIELVSYMTNENIPISYINPMTGGKFTEYYAATGNALTNKNFYVFTTAVTFSAANLFTSIVKDMDLAVIFGEQTGGGACAISYTVLPDGAILVTSSNMTLINENDVVIEDGIPVDIPYSSYPVNWFNIITNLNNLSS